MSEISLKLQFLLFKFCSVQLKVIIFGIMDKIDAVFLTMLPNGQN
jgi:hypothetical protein